MKKTLVTEVCVCDSLNSDFFTMQRPLYLFVYKLTCVKRVDRSKKMIDGDRRRGMAYAN